MHEQGQIEDCGKARIALAAWLLLVRSVGLTLQRAADQARAGRTDQAIALLATLRIATTEAAEQLDSTAGTGDASLDGLVVSLAAAHRSLLELVDRFTGLVRPADVAGAITRFVAALSFDERALGAWLRDHCPDVAEEALAAGDDVVTGLAGVAR